MAARKSPKSSRARTGSGTFKGDDPTTPDVNEAWNPPAPDDAVVEEPAVEEPDVIEPDVVEPDVVEPDVTEPDAEEPEAAAPEAAAPEAAAAPCACTNPACVELFAAANALYANVAQHGEVWMGSNHGHLRAVFVAAQKL